MPPAALYSTVYQWLKTRLSARLQPEWTRLGYNGEVLRLLRRLQTIRLGCLYVLLGAEATPAMTPINAELNEIHAQFNLLKFFAAPPKWATNQSL
ncbi:MAG: hypothetical protein ACLFO5_01625 [Opitutales bacterium]